MVLPLLRKVLQHAGAPGLQTRNILEQNMVLRWDDYRGTKSFCRVVEANKITTLNLKTRMMIIPSDSGRISLEIPSPGDWSH
jgi:hypothetical protein